MKNKKIYFALCLIGISNALASPQRLQSSATPAAYSQAFNYHMGLSAEVNPRTGLLSLNFPLSSLSGKNGQGLDLSIQYNQYDNNDFFKLGPSWRFNLDYVDVAHNTLHLADGSTYPLVNSNNNQPCQFQGDADNSTQCALLYYKNNDVSIVKLRHQDQQINNQNVGYQIRYLSGTQEYFDESGRLLQLENKYGDQLNWSYPDQNTTSIQDAYQNKITINNNSQGQVTVQTPDGKTITLQSKIIQGNNLGVSQIGITAGGMTQSIQINYDANHLINKIVYPTNASDNFSYSALINSPYYAVSALKACYDAAGTHCLNPTTYQMDVQNNHNFLGYDYDGQKTYPQKAGFDGVIELAGNYQYQTKIIGANGTETLNTYDHLHHLIDQKIQDHNGNGLSDTQYTYPCNQNNSCSTLTSLNLPINYDKPLVITSSVSNPLSHTTIKTTQIENTYDEQTGQIIETKQSSYDNSSNQFQLKTDTISHYDNEDNAFGNLLDKTVIAADNSGVKQEVFQYSSDHRDLISHILNVGESANALTPTKTIAYTYGDSNHPATATDTRFSDGSNTLETQEKIVGNNDSEIITRLDANGNSSSKTLDLKTGNIIQTTNALGQATTYTYDGFNRPLVIKDPANNTQHYTYDDTHQTVLITHSNGYIEKAQYDTMGHLIEVDDNWDRTNHAFTNPTFKVLTNTYSDALGLKIESDDLINQVTTKFSYNDPYNRVTQKTIAGASESITYDDVNKTETDKTAYNDAVDSTTTTLYDNLGRVIQENLSGNDTESNQISATYQYDNFDNITQKSTQNAFNSRAQYDFEGKLTSETTTDVSNDNSPSLTRSYTYDMLGNVTQTKINQTINCDSKHPEYCDYAGEIYHYDNIGQVQQITDAQNAHPVSYTYTPLGEISTVTLLNGDMLHYFYDLTTREKTDSCYSKAGKSIADCSNDDAWNHAQYSYYDSGALKGLINSINTVGKNWDQGIEQGVIQYNYFNDGKLQKLIYPDGKTIQYTYNGQGNVASITDASGVTTNYTYIFAGDSEKLQSVSGNGVEVDYAYNPNGSLHSKTRVLANNPKNKITTQYTYTSLGNIASMTHLDGNNNVLASLTYQYDAGGHVIQKISSSNTDNKNALVNFTENDSYQLDRLASVQRVTAGLPTDTTEYTYDAAGNVVNVTHQSILNNFNFNILNELTSLSNNEKTANLTWDDRGNLNKDDVGNQYNFNSSDQLINFQSANSVVQEQYTYYANGLRATRSSGNYAIRYYYDANGNLLNEISGTDSTHYLMGLNREGRTINNKTNWYLYDAHGSVIDYLDGQSNQSQFYDYDAFGALKNASPTNGLSLAENPFQYNGEYTDTASGLIYLKARFYNPNLKIFISRDTYNLDNRYNFANNNPIMNIDPNGHMSVGDWMGTAMGAVAGMALSVMTGGLAEGAVIDALTSVVGSLVSDAVDHKHVSGSSVMISAGVGAVSGDIFGKLGAKSVAASEIVAEDTTQAVAGSDLSLSEINERAEAMNAGQEYTDDRGLLGGGRKEKQRAARLAAKKSPVKVEVEEEKQLDFDPREEDTLFLLGDPFSPKYGENLIGGWAMEGDGHAYYKHVRMEKEFIDPYTDKPISKKEYVKYAAQVIKEGRRRSFLTNKGLERSTYLLNRDILIINKEQPARSTLYHVFDNDPEGHFNRLK